MKAMSASAMSCSRTLRFLYIIPFVSSISRTQKILGIGLGGRCILRCAGVASPTSTPSLNTVVEMQHSGVDPLWTGLPARFSVVHYETPALPDPLPASLDRIAWTSECALALRNRNKPHWALFFQPGAHGSQQSNEVIRNFYTFTLGLRSGKPVQQLEWIFPAKPLVSQCVITSSYADATQRILRITKKKN